MVCQCIYIINVIHEICFYFYLQPLVFEYTHIYGYAFAQ